MLASTISRMMRLGFGVHADELAFRDDNFATHLFQGHDLAELGFFGQFTVLPVVP